MSGFFHVECCDSHAHDSHAHHSHHHHDIPTDTPQDNDVDHKHPCSPFCSVDGLAFDQGLESELVAESMIVEEIEEPFVSVPAVYHFQLEDCIWNPPKG